MSYDYDPPSADNCVGAVTDLGTAFIVYDEGGDFVCHEGHVILTETYDEVLDYLGGYKEDPLIVSNHYDWDVERVSYVVEVNHKRGFIRHYDAARVLSDFEARLDSKKKKGG